jgi:SSS family solute:Na+ symporter
MYAMGLLLNLLLGWDFNMPPSGSRRGIVLAYILLGGLTSAIYNEVLQFFLIVFGFAPLVFLGLKDAGGWSGLQASLALRVDGQQVCADHGPTSWTASVAADGQPVGQPDGRRVVRPVMGLGFVLSFGYWCTDFLVVQRAMAADSMTAARRDAADRRVPKMFFPFLVILPGMIAIALTANAGASGFAMPAKPDRRWACWTTTWPSR